MRRLFFVAVAAISAMVCHSCIQNEVKLEDKSILESVELVIDNDSEEWEINTLRRIRVVYKPTDAIITDVTLDYPEDLIELIPTREQYVFDMRAIKEGEVKIMMTINGARSETLKFQIVDNTPVRKAPKIALYISKTSGDSSKTLCPTQFCCNYSDRLQLSVESEVSGLDFSFYSADETVISTSWAGESDWIVSADMPGLTDVQIIATESDGTEWIYTYEIMVYGHISLSAKCDPVDKTAGFMVEDHPFGRLSGNFYITATLTGWPGKRTNNTYSVEITPYEQYIPFEEGSDFSYIIDIKAAADAIYDKGYELTSSGEKDWWSPRVLDMHFLITLDDPYIIIDEVFDDNDREDPDFINFLTQATFKQVGVAKFNDTSDSNESSGGWISQDIYINLN